MFIVNGVAGFALRQEGHVYSQRRSRIRPPSGEGHVYSQRCSGFALRLLQTSTAIFARCILKRT